MNTFSRRTFLQSMAAIAPFLSAFRQHNPEQEKKAIIMSVLGPIDAGLMGNALIHEHILVDFIGAKLISPDRWNRDVVMDKVLPFLDEVLLAGCNTLVDCTPNYLGRDVVLLKRLSEATHLTILTNTGYYGGSDNKFLPDHAFTETADQLASRWINEWKSGIDKSGIKPGFIKISVNPSTLSDISKKLITAAALCHIKTGLTIASHTGPAIPAFEQMEILRKQKIDPSAFIWVHAQNETDRTLHVKAARQGAWVSLDGLNDDNFLQYRDHLTYMKAEKCLDRTLVSHDAGWYEPGKTGGGDFRGYTTLFAKLIPALRGSAFDEKEISQLIRINPRNAFTIGIRRPKK